MSPQRDRRDAGQIHAAAARQIARRFGALAWLCAWSGVWWALLPMPDAPCPHGPDGGPCPACPPGRAR